ncbi:MULTISPECIES: hypothetical protein [Psychrilyobacter]|uniref:Uncharacterized protein n=1 Tax=Psychrilyobacter piezotolerans TaxID=2293438 RepID=A0ABX9KHV1_9FUSO|nr:MULTISPECIES: hypothetical protein [Psychrilyobacter]MCS5420672.1 hypothetical protein [Psychrilyobacter sp. S5]NDI77846.1 hypothetical protein [Psychrilyobacter piezotolerans]RDE62300.1 hypothetical protein DV867_06945 [Psychrilyobacter sp. S5]REI41398.1 hypothetical protein DYH56_06945 [Psychrilyobacter piezotolerans]
MNNKEQHWKETLDYEYEGHIYTMQDTEFDNAILESFDNNMYELYLAVNSTDHTSDRFKKLIRAIENFNNLFDDQKNTFDLDIRCKEILSYS